MDFEDRDPKSKMNSGIVMPRQKQNHQIKKFFSRNTPPGLCFLSEEKYKVYSSYNFWENADEGLHPREISEPRMGGEAVVYINNLLAKKFLCKMTNKINKKVSRNLLTNKYLYAIIKVQKERAKEIITMAKAIGPIYAVVAMSKVMTEPQDMWVYSKQSSNKEVMIAYAREIQARYPQKRIRIVPAFLPYY